MKIRILSFGILKDPLKGPPAELDLADGSSVNDLKSLLEARCPLLKQLASYLIAVNCEYAPASDILCADDEIALIPPVSGG